MKILWTNEKKMDAKSGTTKRSWAEKDGKIFI